MVLDNLTGVDLKQGEKVKVNKLLQKLESKFSSNLKYSIYITKKTFGYTGSINLQDGSLFLTSTRHSSTVLSCCYDLLEDIKKQHRNFLRVDLSNRLFSQVTPILMHGQR